MSLFFDFIPLVALMGVGINFYVKVIDSKMAETARVMGKAKTVAAASGFAKLWAILEGWKTHILAATAAFANAFALTPHIIGYFDEDLLREWQMLPWASVVDEKTANLITLGCAVLIALTHTFGLNKAAKTPPQGS
jgi:hypothetical protein